MSQERTGTVERTVLSSALVVAAALVFVFAALGVAANLFHWASGSAAALVAAFSGVRGGQGVEEESRGNPGGRHFSGQALLLYLALGLLLAAALNTRLF